MKISFEGSTLEEIIGQMQAFAMSTKNATHIVQEDLRPAPKKKKVEQPEVETVAALDEEVKPSPAKEPKKYSEDDVVAVFQAYVKRETENVGKDEAIAAAKKIIASFGASSSRQIKEQDRAKAIALASA